ncbi:hypothetical protein LUZ63_010249 [Rhynchospora breviuscula]|uniref:SWIRM domain-containing protein n=1 Tax=Rhynchospora breviuscula TaxID=2022672 RepID=A0A9Q0HPA7_9POAL|nr:hypothetical protein LUZ63_010249 [Rhynchospora breviuscula]
MGSDTEKTPVKSEGKSDEDEKKPIGSLFKVRKSRVSNRKKTPICENRVEENPSEDMVSSGEINDTLASIKKKLKRPKSVKVSHVADPVVKEEVPQELESADVVSRSATLKSGNKRLRIDVKLEDEEKRDVSDRDRSAGPNEEGHQNFLSVIFKKSRKAKCQGSDKLAATTSNGIVVESAEEPHEISVPAPEQETETPCVKDEQDTFTENDKEVQRLGVVGLSYCSAGLAEPTVEKGVEEESKEGISGANFVSETEQKEKSEESPVKCHVEEIQVLFREEISQANVVSEVYENEKIKVSSVKECSEDIQMLPGGKGANIHPVSEKNIDSTCSPCNGPLDRGNFVINNDLSLPSDREFEKAIKLEENTVDTFTERQIPGTPDSTRAEADDMSPNHDEATKNEPDAFHEKEENEPNFGNHENQSVLRTRNVKKRRHDDMAYEGDADWEVVVNEQGLFNNLPVDQPDQSFKSRDQYLLIKEEEAINGYVAAVAAGLKARATKPIEKIKFKELLRRKGGLQEYLECRNMILSHWRKDVRHILPLSRFGISDTPLQDESPHESLIREIYLFLNQNGYINAGIASEKEACNSEVKPAGAHIEDIKRPKLEEMNEIELASSENNLAPYSGKANLREDPTLDIYEASTIKDSVKGEPFGPKLPSYDTVIQKKIIIIGAGPSGLAAARHLHRQGFHVTVLEARDRIGGRVHTDRTSLSVPVDLGASIITGVEADLATERQPDPSALICSQLGLELTVLNSDCPLYDSVTGDKVPPAMDEALEAEYNTLLDEMALLVAHHGEKSTQLSLEHGLEYGLRKHRESGFTPSVIECDGLDEIGKNIDGTDVLTPMERRVMNWHFAHLEYGCATMLKEVSLPHWNQDDAYGGFGGAHCMIKGGFSSVVENMANGLDVRLSHVVTEVHYEDVSSGKKAKVCTSNGSEFDGDAVLVTIPLGCLKTASIKFSPDLPDWKKMSIKRLGFGVLNKVVLEFPSVFWDETVDYFGATAEETDLRGRCFMFWNVKKTCDAPVLIALVAGKAAVDGQTISPADHVAHAMMVLRRIFSKLTVPDPVGSVVTNWGSEPFTRGSYSYVAVGASGEDYDILGKPVANCLFFAGEATCKEHPDTVGGAMLSGIREAVRIIDLLCVGRDFVAEVEAMESASKTANRRSDRARNEVRDMSRRLEACDLSRAMYPSVNKEALLKEMFFNAKSTSGRLHLAKELLRLPVDALKSFAGSKEGLGTLNSWILDSLGKNSTQLLRHCVRLLVLVSTDLVAVRISGIGRTVKEKVCLHTSRDIRAIASQLVRVWIEIFRKEKAKNGGLRLLQVRDPQIKGTMQISKSNKKPEGRAMRTEAMLDAKSEASSLHSQRTVHAVESEGEAIPIMSEEEAAAFAAAEAARAAAIAAAQAYASAEAEKAALELPKIPSFHKFANRLHTEESDQRRRLLSGDPEISFRVPACQNQIPFSNHDIPRTSTNSYQCPTIREDVVECSGVPENRLIFRTAWVDVDLVRVDGVKDASAIERWLDQSFEAYPEFYSRLCIPEREEPAEAVALQNARLGGSLPSQVADSKKNSEGRAHGVERVKQGILDYVATLLKPLYKTNKLDREGYKAIMKKTVTKVLDQLSEAEKGMSAFEFLDFKRKNKIRTLVDKLIERQMQARGVSGS